MIAFILSSFIVAYFAVNFLIVAIRNKRDHRFFKKYAPDLPEVPNPQLFSGHLNEIMRPRKNYRLTRDLHEKYGPTFGFYVANQPWVLTKDLDLIKLIEVDHAHRHINRSFWGAPLDDFNHSIFQVRDEEWRRIRRAVSPALTNHKVRSDEVTSLIKGVLDQFEASIERRLAKSGEADKSVVIDANDLMSRYTLATVFSLTYKRDRDIDFDTKLDHWSNLIKTGGRGITTPLIWWSVMFPFLRPILEELIKFHDSGRVNVRLIEFINAAVKVNLDWRKSTAEGRTTKEVEKTGESPERRLIDYMIDAFLERKIKQKTFLGSAVFMIFAGFETTSMTLTVLIWWMVRRPELQTKLRNIILEKGVNDDYILWSINEAIRWAPPVILGTGRELGEDVFSNGIRIPKGTYVMPSTWAIHRDPKIWPDPDDFKPERFENQSEHHPAAFMGFGLGPRNCVGGKLAIHEIQMMLEYLLKNFLIEGSEETEEKFEFSAPGWLWLELDKPIKIKLTRLDT